MAASANHHAVRMTNVIWDAQEMEKIRRKLKSFGIESAETVKSILKIFSWALLRNPNKR
jgi:hypothetical protein